MRDYMLKCWSIRKVENHCLSTLTPPSTRMLLPLVLSHLIWGWKRECCQDSNNVMIKGPEEKHKHIFFFWGKHTCHGQIRWNLSRRSGRDCHGREDSKLPGFQSGFASYHLCELESQEQNSFQIPALLGLFSVQIRVLGKSGKLLSKSQRQGSACHVREAKTAFACRKQIPAHSDALGWPYWIRNLREFPTKH